MKRETTEWLRISREDLQSAAYLFEKKLFRMVCYHAQQTVEKIFKAVLVENEIDIPKVHNLLDLNNAIRRLGYETNLTNEEAIFLNSIYRWRYPPDLGLLPLGEPTEMDAEKALRIAGAMNDWSKDNFEPSTSTIPSV